MQFINLILFFYKPRVDKWKSNYWILIVSFLLNITFLQAQNCYQPSSSSHFLLVGVNLVSSFASVLAIPSNSNFPKADDDVGDDDEKDDYNFGDMMKNTDNSTTTTNSTIVNGRNRGLRSEQDKERLRLSLLKQIQSSDTSMCFPKVLCGLSVDSSKHSRDMDSYFVRSYIQLMKSANLEDQSSEETTKISSDPRKDALSSFLVKSGLLKPKPKSSKRDKPKVKISSHSASSEEEQEDEQSSDEPTRYKSTLEKKNEALRKLLTKRRLYSDDDKNKKDEIILKPFGIVGKDDENEDESKKPVAKIGSLVSSWVPWVSLSFGKQDSSFEKDPFFKGGKGNSKINKKDDKIDQWQKNLDELALLMALQDSSRRRRRQKKNKSKFEGRSFRDLSAVDDEIKIYSTAVDIGKKLKDSKQCDYLYNGCPVAYADIIKIIASIRKDMKESDETVESLSKEIFEYSQKKKVTKQKKPAQTQNKPMTQISHTLPNGEKVEINVQLSSKHENGHVEIESPHGDSFVSDEEPENVDNDATSYHQNHPTKLVELAEDLVEADENDPAISASYEMAVEEQGDHRKPTPLYIFNKVSMKKKPSTTTTTPTPKYAVTKKRRTTITPTTPAMKLKLRPKPTTITTIRSRPTPPTWPSKKPSSPQRIPTTNRPIREPTVKPRKPIMQSETIYSSSSFTTAKPKTSKPTTIITRTSNKATIPLNRFPQLSSNTKEGNNNNHPGDHFAPSHNKKTTLRPNNYNYYDDTDDTSSPHKITIEIDKSTSNEDNNEEEEDINNNSEDKEIPIIEPSSTTPPPRPRPTFTTTTTTTTTTLLPIKSFMDPVVENMFHTYRPKIRKTTTTTTMPPKKHRRPINYNKKSPTTHSQQHENGQQMLFHNLDETTYAASVESSSGSGENHHIHHVFSISQLGGEVSKNPFETKHEEQEEQEQASPATRDPPTSISVDTDDPYISIPPFGKKRITYKNPKRPYLILMKPGTNRPKIMVNGNKQRPSISSTIGMTNSNSNYNYYSSLLTTADDDLKMPLIIEPGSSYSTAGSHWTPNY